MMEKEQFAGSKFQVRRFKNLEPGTCEPGT